MYQQELNRVISFTVVYIVLADIFAHVFIIVVFIMICTPFSGYPLYLKAFEIIYIICPTIRLLNLDPTKRF